MVMTRRMRRRALWLATLVGVLTLVLGWTATTAASRRVVPVVVAARAVPANTVLTAADLTTVALAGHVPSSYLHQPSALIGKTLVHALAADQPVLLDDVGRSAQRQGLTPSEVGVYLPVNLASSAGVVPGDRVDVLWTGGSQSRGASPLQPGATLLTGARVLAVVTSTGSAVLPAKNTSQTVGSLAAAVPAAVELAVPRQAAGNVALAAASGQIWLALDPWGTPGSLGIGSTEPTPALGTPLAPPSATPQAGASASPSPAPASPTPASPSVSHG